MTANSVKEAWKMANDNFPTDYEYDVKSSENAGYPVYWSTREGTNAWISDLGNRLELNLPSGVTLNIWIDERHPLEKAGFHKNVVGIWVA